MTGHGASADDVVLVGYLADRDAACPVCDYNLRGLKKAVCPECAAPLRLQVGSENLRIGPWSLCIVSLTMGLGFDGVVAFLLGLSLAIAPPPSPGLVMQALWVLGGFATLAAVCGGGVWWFLTRRRVWNRVPVGRQRAIGWSLFTVTGIVHAIYGWVVLAMFS